MCWNLFLYFSLRAQFVEEGASINMLHGSDSEEQAQKEIEYFFPMEQTIAVIKPDAYGTKGDIKSPLKTLWKLFTTVKKNKKCCKYKNIKMIDYILVL